MSTASDTMKPVFADTFFYLALLSRNDADRKRATDVAATITGPVVTSAWVLTEVADAMSLPLHRTLFTRFLRALGADPNVTIVPASNALFDRALELYADRPDQSWPLTDCVSFVVMNDAGITDALTADRHFEQAGFIALLKP